MSSTDVDQILPDYSQPWARGCEHISQEGTSYWQDIREGQGWSREDVFLKTGGIVTPGRQADFEWDYCVDFPTLDEIVALAVIYGERPGDLLNECYERTGRELLAEQG